MLCFVIAILPYLYSDLYPRYIGVVVLSLCLEIMSQSLDAVMATFKPVIEDHQFGCWSIKATKCHILASEGPERQKYTICLSVY